MPYKIKIVPAGVHFYSEVNLLSDALEQSIPLEHSCKNGQCGVCSAELVLGQAENENGVVVSSGQILTCKSRALSDVTLKANYYQELVGQKIQTIPCKVASFKYVTDDIIVIDLRFPPTIKFDYRPGQYIDLDFKGIKRSYSIANARENESVIELHIRKVIDGKMSNLLFNGLKENQLMRLEGPKGTFFVRENKKTLVLLATGTGIAPIKAIVENLLSENDCRNIFIYWGMQYEKELYCSSLFELSEKHEHIKFRPVLSKEVSKKHLNGYVQSAVCNDFDSLQDVEVYACGAINMINEAREMFIKHQLPIDAFFSDAFTAAK